MSIFLDPNLGYKSKEDYHKQAAQGLQHIAFVPNKEIRGLRDITVPAIIPLVYE